MEDRLQCGNCIFGRGTGGWCQKHSKKIYIDSPACFNFIDTGKEWYEE